MRNKIIFFFMLVLSAFLLAGCSQDCSKLASEERNDCCKEVMKDASHDACDGEWIWDTAKSECVFSCYVGEGITNPASKYCVDQGYDWSIVKDAGGNEYGVCKFPDGSECEEWDYYNGKCKPGDSKIAVPTTEGECTSLGGKWGRFGLADYERCNLPTKDADKFCTDGGDCEAGLCVSESPGGITGKCPAWKLNFGCMSIVENGKSISICID
ncbi:MAG: DUF333 domain-containing protein [Candidatus Nanoarchaeia archaeon]